MTPPRILRTDPPSSDVFRKKNCKKFQLGEKNDEKNIFSKSFPLLYFESSVGFDSCLRVISHTKMSDLVL